MNTKTLFFFGNMNLKPNLSETGRNQFSFFMSPVILPSDADQKHITFKNPIFLLIQI